MSPNEATRKVDRKGETEVCTRGGTIGVTGAKWLNLRVNEVLFR